MVLDDVKDGHGLRVDVDAVELTDLTISGGAEKKKKGTRYDQRDMVRMGKRQELRVRQLLQTGNWKGFQPQDQV